MAILKKGLRGEPVRRLQHILGVEEDGIFGAGTDAALREHQKGEGLLVDGIAGPDTFYSLGLYELILLKKGQKGELVKKLQKALKVDADGVFGDGTKKAVMAFQKAQGLVDDGVVGPATLFKLNFLEEVTAEVVAKAEVPANYVDPVVPATMQADASVAAAGKEAAAAKEDKGIWSTVKGWFT